jgi:hypothetical protein
MGEQRTRELRPIDIAQWGLLAWRRDKARRTVTNAYLGSSSGDDDVLASSQVLSYEARLGAPRKFAERRPDYFFPW